MSGWRGCGGTGRFPHTDKKEGAAWGNHGFPHGSEPQASDGQAASLSTPEVQDWFSVTRPCVSTKRPGRPRRSSQDGPAAPSRNAAFAATSAARQDPAATDTTLHGERDGRPDAGSIKWYGCLSVPLVASPPPRRVTGSPPGRPTTTGRVVATSPPAETVPPSGSSASASSAVAPLTTPLRSRSIPPRKR